MSGIPNYFTYSLESCIPDREPIWAWEIEIKPLIAQGLPTKFIKNQVTGEQPTIFVSVTLDLTSLVHLGDSAATLIPVWASHLHPDYL